MASNLSIGLMVLIKASGFSPFLTERTEDEYCEESESQISSLACRGEILEELYALSSWIHDILPKNF